MDEEYLKVIEQNVERILGSVTLDKREMLKAIFQVFTNVAEDVTENERIVFTTLFSRLAYIGGKYKMSSQDLHHIHVFRRANEKILFEGQYDRFIELGVYVIRVLMNYAGGGVSPELSNDCQECFAVEDKKIVSFRPIVEGLITAVDSDNYVLSFIREDGGSEIELVQFDKGDKNEIFNHNIESISKHINLPVHANLIDVEQMDDGSMVPQGLVLMPDYLVDVTAVAECFQDYGTETLLSVIGRFRSLEPTSIPLLIGNVANMFLDELIADPEISFGTLIPKIFEFNPIAMSLYSDEDIREIIAKSRIHFDNLRRVVNSEAPALGIDRSKVYLEPSFYSRDYGLQGRLDLFHHDSRSKRFDIIELKSGSPYKANVYGLSNNHYVQTLLYDLLIKSTFGKGIKPSSYILYSKLGVKGLKYAPPAKAQQYEAMKIRNELIVLEYISAFDLDKYATLLQFMKAENFERVKGFQLSNLQSFRKTFDKVGQLLQEYLMSFVAFVKREQFLSKTGVHGVENSNGLAALWLENPEEKIDRFAILEKLEIITNDSDGDTPTVTLKHTNTTSSLASFREGDIAVLYPYHDRPRAVLQNQVFKCGVIERTKDSITVKLRSKQYNHGLFRKYNFWNIEEDKLDSSFTSSYRSIYKFICSPAAKRELLLGVTEPRTVMTRVATSDTNALSAQQQLLLEYMIQAKDYYLLWGPPGTGKTSIMIKSYIQYIIEETDENILLLAYTNRAVDELCDAIRALGEKVEDCYLRVGSATATGPAYRSRLVGSYIAGSSKRSEILDKLSPIRIVVGTVSSLVNKPELFKLKKFASAVVDEASQILEPNIVGLLTEVGKFILVGDHKQLPAVVQQDSRTCQVNAEALRSIGITDMSMSFFERLYRQCQSNGWAHAYGLLSQQGRMHQQLVQFPSVEFYEGKLGIIENLDRLQADQWDAISSSKILPKDRLVYVPTMVSDGLNHKTNEYEAEVVSQIIKMYRDELTKKQDPLDQLEIGVITPYRAQIALIKNVCEERGVNLTNITVDTVERYQGGARNLIILSLCVNKERQFRSLVSLSSDGVDRKLNVALTRAREQIVVVGNKDMLSKNEIYGKLIGAATLWELSTDS